MLIRHPDNPILTREDIPDVPPLLRDVSSVFNPGAVRFDDGIVLLLRVQNRGRETFIMTARSRDGVRFEVADRPVVFEGIERVEGTIHHCYDARITFLDGAYHILFAMDMESDCRLGLARTEDFERFAFLGVVSDEDNRNGVLFPEKVGGRYLRLDRPNRMPAPGPGASPLSGNLIRLAESDDLLEWREVKVILEGRWHYWDELMGAGPPPIKTREGWLQIYHGIATHFVSSNIYQAGAFLMDLADPSKVIARGRLNVLEPRELYELTGQVPNVVFPGGAVPERVDAEGFADPDGELHVYYGAADTCVGLARCKLADLIEAARLE